MDSEKEILDAKRKVDDISKADNKKGRRCSFKQWLIDEGKNGPTLIEMASLLLSVASLIFSILIAQGILGGDAIIWPLVILCAFLILVTVFLIIAKKVACRYDKEKEAESSNNNSENGSKADSPEN